MTRLESEFSSELIATFVKTRRFLRVTEYVVSLFVTVTTVVPYGRLPEQSCIPETAVVFTESVPFSIRFTGVSSSVYFPPD